MAVESPCHFCEALVEAPLEPLNRFPQVVTLFRDPLAEACPLFGDPLAEACLLLCDPLKKISTIVGDPCFEAREI